MNKMILWLAIFCFPVFTFAATYSRYLWRRKKHSEKILHEYTNQVIEIESELYPLPMKMRYFRPLNFVASCSIESEVIVNLLGVFNRATCGKSKRIKVAFSLAMGIGRQHEYFNLAGIKDAQKTEDIQVKKVS